MPDPTSPESDLDRLPAGWVARHFKPIGYCGLGGHRGAFKIAIKQSAGRWYLYLGNFWAHGISIVDVTDPTRPRFVRLLETPDYTESNQVTLHGDLLISTYHNPLFPRWETEGKPVHEHTESFAPANALGLEGLPRAPAGIVTHEGAALWNIADPVSPELLSVWRCGFPWGPHRNGYPGGKYAFITAEQAGFKGFVLVILDVSDPRSPEVVSRFWLHGQRDGEVLPPGAVMPTLHGPAMLSPDGKMLTMGYTPALINVDISDIRHPKLIGQLNFIPPFIFQGAQSVHSAIPLWNRGLVVVLGERSSEDDSEAAVYAAVVDNRDPAKPRLMSIFPTPRPSPEESPYRNYFEKGGRFGPHNGNQEIDNPDVAAPENLMLVTWFNAGLRAFDISDPYLPTETGWFVPPKPPVRSGWMPKSVLQTQTEDVAVDIRGNIYVTDKQWGLFVLRYDGPLAAELTENRTARRAR